MFTMLYTGKITNKCSSPDEVEDSDLWAMNRDNVNSYTYAFLLLCSGNHPTIHSYIKHLQIVNSARHQAYKNELTFYGVHCVVRETSHFILLLFTCPSASPEICARCIEGHGSLGCSIVIIVKVVLKMTNLEAQHFRSYGL